MSDINDSTKPKAQTKFERLPTKIRPQITTVKRRIPTWIRVQAPKDNSVADLKSLLREHKIVTVCEEASCQDYQGTRGDDEAFHHHQVERVRDSYDS